MPFIHRIGSGLILFTGMPFIYKELAVNGDYNTNSMLKKCHCEQKEIQVLATSHFTFLQYLNLIQNCICLIHAINWKFLCLELISMATLDLHNWCWSWVGSLIWYEIIQYWVIWIEICDGAFINDWHITNNSGIVVDIYALIKLIGLGNTALKINVWWAFCRTVYAVIKLIALRNTPLKINVWWTFCSTVILMKF